jgi:hypothetical protein
LPDVARREAAYNGRVQPTFARQPHLHFATGGLFLEAVAAREFARLGACFEPDVSMSALLSDGFDTWIGPAEVSGAFAEWFGDVDCFELADASVGQIGSLLELRWRVRCAGGRFDDDVMVIEQHAFVATGRTGRIHRISLLCSGFWNEPPYERTLR